jgi:hypothetical protein
MANNQLPAAWTHQDDLLFRKLAVAETTVAELDG